jgi:phosphatidylinositol kinase/protein kinase (PI-3  family)
MSYFIYSFRYRHNGNILIDQEGHIIHVNFNYVLGMSPVLPPSCDLSPWKLSKEYLELMGGSSSYHYHQYKHRCIEAFLVLRKHAPEAIAMMEIMNFNSNFPAFK